ncbi:MAG: DpnI domain-containing protein [Silvibacterium sp.]|jgi:type II restriction enzyme
MDLALPTPPAGLKSASQMARVSTERWAADNFYCAACGTDLITYPPNTKIYDFYSAECREKFQLKSASRIFSTSILGGEYETTRESILKDAFPSLILLYYDRAKWAVQDLSLVHRACITTSCIAPRIPLSSTARRAGWQGYTITLREIPAQGQIAVVRGGQVREKSQVLAQWKQTDSLLKSRPETRGWLADVLRCVERCFTNFTLANIYDFESELAAKHPDNHNVRPKIRQQLQFLRDLGFIEFLESGEYRYVDSQSL